MLYTNLRKGVRDAAYEALSEYFPNETTAPIIFSHLNGPEPAESYVIINFVATEQVGRSFVSTYTNEIEELTIQASYEVRVQFAFCGSKSGDMAYSFSHRIGNNPVINNALAANGLGFMRKSGIRRAPQKRETQWVEYNNIDVTFSYVVSTQQQVDIIEHALLEDVLSGQQIVVPPYETP